MPGTPRPILSRRSGTLDGPETSAPCIIPIKKKEKGKEMARRISNGNESVRARTPRIIWPEAYLDLLSPPLQELTGAKKIFVHPLLFYVTLV